MCDSCGGQTHDGECTLNLDGDILTPIICMLCGKLHYSSDYRWKTGVYESIYEDGNIATLYGYKLFTTGHSAVYRDVLSAYYAVYTVDGTLNTLSFDWAINQGFTDYGEFTLTLYHNGQPFLVRDFTSEANPYDKVISEEYTYVASGELQVFEFEFKKIRAGNWADSGRCSDTKHIFLTAPTCSEPMICGVCGYEGVLAPDNHASNNFAYQSTGAFSHSIICLDCEAVIDEHDGVIDGWCEICQAYVLEE